MRCIVVVTIPIIRRCEECCAARRRQTVGMQDVNDELLSLADLEYELPAELIAQQPSPRRDGARLLVVDRSSSSFRDASFTDLAELLAPGDLVVLNNTRVLPAKLTARRATGGKVGILFLREHGEKQWEVLLQSSGRLRPGERIALQPVASGDEIQLLSRGEAGRWRVALLSDNETETVLNRSGRSPLPPYIRRSEAADELDASDGQRYQTVFAVRPGAVAAPTAGLHFSEATLGRLARRSVEHVFVTLHVGLGTFAPLKVASLDEHTMHSEWYELDEAAASTVTACRKRGGHVVAVGTTSLRVLETCAAKGPLSVSSGWTDLFIRPPYAFRAVDRLLTNFHLPRTTLLALVMAFADRQLIRAAYTHAMAQRYRFYSYGDAMLIL